MSIKFGDRNRTKYTPSSPSKLKMTVRLLVVNFHILIARNVTHVKEGFINNLHVVFVYIYL